MSNIDEFSNEAPDTADLEVCFQIMATIIQLYWLHKQGMATDLFRWVIRDEWVYFGKSKSGGKCNEHVVPLIYLRDESTKMYDQKHSTVEDVASFLKRNFKVVKNNIGGSRTFEFQRDHRSIKLRLGPMLGLKRFRCASITIAGIELMHRIRKGQFTLGKLRINGKTAPEIWNAVLAA